MAVLVFTAIFTESAEVRAHTLQSLRLVTVWPMFSAAMLSLITGWSWAWAASTAGTAKLGDLRS